MVDQRRKIAAFGSVFAGAVEGCERAV